MRIKVFGSELEIDESKLEASEAEIREQISQYLKGERKCFDTGVAFSDSFTGDVMRQIADIGYGETKTYGEIADILDSSPVAVGQACGRNPVPIVVPCHRAVGKNSIGGYIAGKKVKQKLLNLEQKNRFS
jgi:methylated-DNA-[protein]-cysteine S-methyltransferase